MDLVTGAKRVVVAMQHAANGKSKIVKNCKSAADISQNHRPCRDRHGGDRILGWPCDLDGNGSRLSVADVSMSNCLGFMLCPRSRSRCLPCRSSHIGTTKSRHRVRGRTVTASCSRIQCPEGRTDNARS